MLPTPAPPRAESSGNDMLEYLAAYKPLSDLVSWLSSRRRRLTDEQKVQLKAKWKPRVEEHLRAWHRDQLRHDVIVHDVKRGQEYPEALGGKGISSWFRVGLVDTYHDGTEMG